MTGIASAAGGVCCLIAAVPEVFRYSPYEDPGAGTSTLLLLACFLALTGLPVLILAVRAVALVMREHAALVARLTPGQRALLYWSELAGLVVAHEIFRRRNRETSARLTASVLGEESPARDDFAPVA